MSPHYRILILLGFMLSACGGTATQSPTAAPVPTVAPQPTTAPAPTAIPAPTSAPTAPAAPPTAMPTSMAMHTQYPVNIQDCGGRTTLYDKAPQRVVTIDPSVTEMLLVLGLKARIVGYTEFYKPEQQWPPTQADMRALHEINDGANYPSKEAIVALTPDLVTSAYAYAFFDPLPDRDGWTKLGVKSYQLLCPTGKQSDFAVLYQDLRNFGIIFDVQERAEAEIQKIQTHIQSLQQKVKDAGLASKHITIYDGTPDHPPVYGGTINAVITLAGASYVWADTDPNSIPSWEQFIAAKPEVIWIVPDAGTSVADLKRQLESDTRFTMMPAVMQKAYVIVPQADATVESPRLVDGLAQLIDGLLALK